MVFCLSDSETDWAWVSRGVTWEFFWRTEAISESGGTVLRGTSQWKQVGDDRVSIGFLLFLRFSFGEGLNFGSEFLAIFFPVSPTECVLATVGTWFDFHPSSTGETSSRTTSWGERGARQMEDPREIPVWTRGWGAALDCHFCGIIFVQNQDVILDTSPVSMIFVQQRCSGFHPVVLHFFSLSKRIRTPGVPDGDCHKMLQLSPSTSRPATLRSSRVRGAAPVRCRAASLRSSRPRQLRRPRRRVDRHGDLRQVLAAPLLCQSHSSGAATNRNNQTTRKREHLFFWHKQLSKAIFVKTSWTFWRFIWSIFALYVRKIWTQRKGYRFAAWEDSKKTPAKIWICCNLEFQDISRTSMVAKHATETVESECRAIRSRRLWGSWDSYYVKDEAYKSFGASGALSHLCHLEWVAMGFEDVERGILKNVYNWAWWLEPIYQSIFSGISIFP